MGFRLDDKASTTERIVAALCYLTMGLAGIIYIIISRSSSQAPFFRFHFLQAIVLGILSLLFGWAASLMTGMTSMMLGFLDGLIPQAGGMIANGIGWFLGILLTAFSLLPIYGLIWALMGKYAEIPFISDIVRQNMR